VALDAISLGSSGTDFMIMAEQPAKQIKMKVIAIR